MLRVGEASTNLWRRPDMRHTLRKSSVCLALNRPARRGGLLRCDRHSCTPAYVMRTLFFAGICRNNAPVNTISAISKNDAANDEGHNAVASRIRAVLAAHGRLGTDPARLREGDDLYAAGMNSLASVNVMLALEGEFDIEFPDHMLNRSVFSSVAAIEAAVRKITRG